MGQYFGDGGYMGTDKEKALKEDTKARADASFWAVKALLANASDADVFMISDGKGNLKDMKYKDAKDENVPQDKFRGFVNDELKDSVLRRYRGELGIQTM